MQLLMLLFVAIFVYAVISLIGALLSALAALLSGPSVLAFAVLALIILGLAA